MPGLTTKLFMDVAKLYDKIEESLIKSKATNSDRLVAKAFFWDAVSSYADKQFKAAWKQLETEEIVDKKGLPPGDHVLHDGERFLITAKTSQPYKTFSPEVLAEQLNKKYKVPKPVSLGLIDEAKIDGNSRTTVTIAEKA